MSTQIKNTCDQVNVQGKVVEIIGNVVKVVIQRESACAACHAKDICSVLDGEEKLLEVDNFLGMYQVGDSVKVSIEDISGVDGALFRIYTTILNLSYYSFSFIKHFQKRSYIRTYSTCHLSPVLHWSIFSKKQNKKDNKVSNTKNLKNEFNRNIYSSSTLLRRNRFCSNSFFHR